VPVTVAVRRNGAAVPDGTVVRFSVDSGALTAASTTTVGGSATVGVQGARAGIVTVSASADLFGRVVSDRRTLIYRVPPTPLQLLVPAYTFPGVGNPAWASIFNSIRAKDALVFNVIIKQADTLYTTVDPAYLAAAQRVRAEGGRVIGHLPTDGARGTPTVAALKAAVDAYLRDYGSTLGGFFLDNMTTTGASLDYYREIYTYIKGKSSELGVFGNTRRVPTDETFLQGADVLVTSEGNAATYLQALATTDFPAWIYRYPHHGFALLAQDVATCAAMQSIVQSARTPKSNTGMLYITNDTAGANGTLLPYDTLPSYWELLVSTLDAINRGRAVPACGP
jgi:Spherulation-specific family 4